MGHLRPFPWLAAALFLVAGCSKPPAAPAEGPVIEPLDTGIPDAGTIEGVLVNEEELPVEGAIAAVRAADVWGISDAGGGFRIEGVPPGTHEITAAGIGFDVTTQSVEVEPNAITRGVVLKLVEVAVIRPFHETETHTNILKRQQGLSNDGPDQQNVICIPKEGLRRYLVEAEWTPQPTASYLHLTYRDRWYASNSGPDRYLYRPGYSPVHEDMFPGELATGADVVFNGYNGFCYLHMWRSLPYDLGGMNLVENASFAIDLRVDSYLTFFYWEPGDPGFTALASREP